MTHDEHVRAGFNESSGRGSLPQNRALGPIAPHGRNVSADFGFLYAPCLFARCDQHGLLGHTVALESGEAQALHHRVAILDAVAERAGRRVHDDAFERQAHVVNQNDQLLGEVHVHRRTRVNQLIVRHRRGDNRAIILVFADAQDDAFALGLFRNRDQKLIVEFGLAGTENQERQTGGLENLTHDLFRVRGGVLRAVGLRGVKLQQNQISAERRRGFRPLDRVVRDIFPRVQEHRRPIAGLAVLNFDRDRGRVRYRPFEM